MQVYHCRLRRRHKEADFDSGNSVEKLQPFFGEATPPAKEGSVAVPSPEGGSTAATPTVPSAAASVPTTTTNGEKVETETSKE